MKKDKEWAQEEVDRYLSYEGVDEARNALMFAKGVINQLDEVEVPELPVVPQYVADYIETYKGRGFSLGTWLNFVNYDDELESKTEEWLYGGSHEEKLRREYLLIDAIRYGYEVKKEKLYHVVNKENYFMLRKYDGLVNILHVSSSMSRDEYGKDTRFMLTEREIKDYDGRYFAFAQEVTE